MTQSSRGDKGRHREENRFRALRYIEGTTRHFKQRRKKRKVRRAIDKEERWAKAEKMSKSRVVIARALVLIFITSAICAVAIVVMVVRRKSLERANGQRVATEKGEFWDINSARDIGAKAETGDAMMLEPSAAVGKVQRLLAARDVAEVEGLIMPGAIPASDAVEFLGKFPHAAEIHWVGRVESSAIPAVSLIVVPDHGPLGVVFFRKDIQEEWKIDFDAFARYSAQSVGKFIGGEINGGTFRLTASADYYFNGGYSDESAWLCYCLKSPDHDEIIYGYCRRDSAQGKAMAVLEKNSTKRGLESGAFKQTAGPVSFRVTLELRRLDSVDKRQVEIASVVAEDWMAVAENYDQRCNSSTD